MRLSKRVLSCIFVLSLCFTRSALAHHYTVDGVIDDGELQVFIKNDLSGKVSKTEYQVKKNRKVFKILFRGNPPSGLFTGQRVKLRGTKLNANAIRVGTHDEDALTILGGSLPVALGGIHQILMLRIISGDNSVTPATVAQVASVAGQQKPIYEETSYQLFSMQNDRDFNGQADVYTVTIPTATAGLTDTSAFSVCTSAKSAASTQLGLNTSLWDHVVCILPPNMSYSWYGQAYINGKDVVINGNYASGYPFGLAHELGHNIGMHHANTPPATEYGDSTCIMGGNAGTAPRHFNAPHEVQMGWLSTTAGADGTYVLNAVEVQPGLRTSPDTVLKIRDQIAGQDLYISFRAAIGSYSSGPINPLRTAIHSFNGGAVQTYLLGTLGDGESFTQNGITITQLSHTASSATIVIGTQCTAATQTITLSPASQMSGTASTKRYTVSVKNNDVNCGGAATFSLSNTLPGTGWSAQFGASSLDISSGQTASTTLDLTPPSTLAAGNYSFTVSASASGHSTVNQSGGYVLDNIAPSTPSNLTATISRKTKVIVKWSAATDSGGAGVADYDIYRNGAVIATVAGLQYTDSPGTGTFQYYAKARDNAGNVGSQSNTATVTISGGKR